MNPEPLKGKLKFKDEDDLYNYVCETIFKCSGKQPTESDPFGCTGCNAQEEWFDEHYSDMIIDESKEKQFASKKDIKSAVEWYQKYKGKPSFFKRDYPNIYYNSIKTIIDIEIFNDWLLIKAFEDVMVNKK